MRCPHCEGHIDVEKNQKIADILEKSIWDFDRVCESKNCEYVGVAELPNGITSLLIQGNSVYAQRILKVIAHCAKFYIDKKDIDPDGYRRLRKLVEFINFFNDMDEINFLDYLSGMAAGCCFDYIWASDPKTHQEIQDFAAKFLEVFIKHYQNNHERTMREHG